MRGSDAQGPSGPLSGRQGPSGPLSGRQGPSGPLSGRQGPSGPLSGRPVEALPYAQTNLQLLNQMRQAARSEGDLKLVHNAYEWATGLFSAQFRPSGKTFLAHLVGTAGILARHGARGEAVAAGLAHASYAQGDWGDASGGRPTDERRSALKAALGVEVEGLVHSYTQLRWNPETVAGLRARAASGVAPLTPLEVEVATMRLANLLEDYLDLGIAYSAKGSKATHADPILDDAMALCGALGLVGLGEELRRSVDANAQAELNPNLRHPETGSRTIAPRSQRRRSRLILTEQAQEARKYVRRRMGR